MLRIARVLKSNGTLGDILIGLYDCTVEDIDTEEPVFITFDGLPVPFFIESITAKGTSKAIAHITDVDKLEDAEELVGLDICIEAESEEDLQEDFTGWTVYDHGKKAGTVSGIEPIPGNLCLYIGEKLIPLHEDFIVSADPDRKELYLDLPDGIFEL